MAGERKSDDNSPPPLRGGVVDELAAAGFTHAVEVGRGGAGVVFRCYQTSLARSVAVKVMASDLDEDNRERFLREGYAMGGLCGHPNIVQVGVTESNRPYIVMPYHAAGSLAQRIRRVGPIAWPDALKIGVKMCGALETAHRAGTLHRDIKPANVLVNDYGEPQLSDFGIARIAGGFETQTGFFTGTIAFTAAEVLAGKPPTTRSDVYSLGATIYALIAGNAAHERKTGEDLIAHYLRIGSTPVPDMRPGGIPADVCAAIKKAMSLDPASRQASAAELGRELQAAQRHNGLIPDSMALSEPVADQREEGADARQPLGSGHTGTPVPTFGAPPPPTGGPPPPAGTPPPMAEAPTRHAMHLASLPWVAQQAGASPEATSKTWKRDAVITARPGASVVVVTVLGGLYFPSSAYK